MLPSMNYLFDGAILGFRTLTASVPAALCTPIGAYIGYKCGTKFVEKIMETDFVNKRAYKNHQRFVSSNQSWKEKIVTKGVGGVTGLLIGMSLASNIVFKFFFNRIK